MRYSPRLTVFRPSQQHNFRWRTISIWDRRTLAARKHFEAVNALPLPHGAENLYIFARGYPSKELLAEMIEGKMCFLMRVRKKFNTDIDLASRTEIVHFEHNEKQYYVRMFKLILDSGEEETLITNLKAKHLRSCLASPFRCLFGEISVLLRQRLLAEYLRLCVVVASLHNENFPRKFTESEMLDSF